MADDLMKRVANPKALSEMMRLAGGCIWVRDPAATTQAYSVPSASSSSVFQTPN
jgi:hypothetical protein